MSHGNFVSKFSKPRIYYLVCKTLGRKGHFTNRTFNFKDIQEHLLMDSSFWDVPLPHRTCRSPMTHFHAGFYITVIRIEMYIELAKPKQFPYL